MDVDPAQLAKWKEKWKKHYRYKHGHFPSSVMPDTVEARILGLGIMAGRVHAELPKEEREDAGKKFRKALQMFRDDFGVSCRTPQTDAILLHDNFIPEYCRMAARETVHCFKHGIEAGLPITVGAYMDPEQWLPPEKLAELEIIDID